MKKYIGTQQVEAEPMTMREAYRRNLLQKGKVPNDSDKDNLGFYIRYQNGYESWLPAVLFCNIYKIADTSLEKIIVEYQELKNKINKLEEFFISSDFQYLNIRTKELIAMQLHIMIEYSLILKERIENM